MVYGELSMCNQQEHCSLVIARSHNYFGDFDNVKESKTLSGKKTLNGNNNNLFAEIEKLV